MNKIKLTKSILLSLSILICNLTSMPSLAQTTLIKNVKGYTHTAQGLTQFSALLFDDQGIQSVLSKQDSLPNSNNIRVIDGQGKTLIPGLIDAHGHVLSYGLSLLRANLFGITSEAAAVQEVVNYTKHNTESVWIQGRGWNQVNWPSKSFPTAKSLDKYFPTQPVILGRVDGHAIWVNSKAMELVGLNEYTKDVDGGEIIRDKQGKPTGVLIDNAMALVYKKMPGLTQAEIKNALLRSMQSLANQGLTSIHDAGVDANTIKAYKSLAKENKMPIRVNVMIDALDPEFDQLLKQGHFESQDKTLTINSVKISADGALGSRGAALITDYSDKPGHRGLLLHSQEKLNKLMLQAMQAGFQVNTHAIGDNANVQVINNYERLIKLTDSKALRHRIEHAQVLQTSDIPRFHELGIIASMQATHATSDKNMAEDRLGSKRIKGAYAWRSLIEAKAVIAAGSDFPVEYPNPFYGLHASVTRQDKQNMPAEGWYAKQSMTMTEAFQTFTTNAAYAGHQEHFTGSIEKNKKADFILIDQNIFTIKSKDIWKTQVLQTWVNGKRVDSINTK